jgi:Domain of unknown function (DUF5593)
VKCPFGHDWLLVETLGNEPAVVAHGRQGKNLIPITALLRRGPYLAATRTAIAESVQTDQRLTRLTPKSDRVIRHRADVESPQRPIPGRLKWELTPGLAAGIWDAGHRPGLRLQAHQRHPVP